MNYVELDTASNILEAFDNCNNAGEEIELFEYLATRPNPPVGAFVSILNEVQLEPVLVLTIKAFGMITDRDLKELWQQNDVVLKLLSEKAKSGASDLIRWTAAVAIDAIGFGIVKISQHLPEKPVKIAERIVESKRKILIDSDDKSKGEQKIADRNDYRSFIDFWVYGATYDLRAITAKYRGKNSSIVVEEVVKAQGIHGIKETNKLFQKAEDRDYLDELTKQVYENQLFEEFTHRLCTKLLKQENLRGFEHFIINQGHCLQSDDPQIRLKAASIILDINENVLNALDSYDSRLLSIAKAISDCDFNLSTDFYYKSLVYEYLKEIVDNLRMASNLVSRDGVSKHLADYLKKLSKDLDFLSPGLNWKQIQAIDEIKRQEESQRQDKIRKKEKAEADRRQQEVDKKRWEEKVKWEAGEARKRAVELAEKEKSSRIEEQRRIVQVTEEKRRAKLKSNEDFLYGLVSFFMKSVLVLATVAFSIWFLIGYVHATFTGVEHMLIGIICFPLLGYFFGFVFGFLIMILKKF